MSLRVPHFSFGFVVALAALTPFLLCGPSPTQRVSQTEFSIERATEHLHQITRVPRPIGSLAHAEVREYLVDELRALGLSPVVQETTTSNFGYGWIKAGRVKNVLARVHGRAPGPAVLLAAHYDSAHTSPGASDAGAGVVSLLEAARVLSSGPAPKHDVIFLFTDGEERGLLGATAFAFEHPWKDDVGVVLNFEARGVRGPVAMFETTSNNASLIRGYSTAAPYPTGNSLMSSLKKLLPNDTDMTMYTAAGLRGLNFAFADGLHHYHTSLDNLENLDPQSLEHMGTTALELAKHFANKPPPPTEADRIYFDVLGAFLLSYSPGWAWFFWGLTVIAVALFLYWSLAETQLQTVLAGCAAFLVSLVAGIGAVVIASWLVRSLVPWRLGLGHFKYFASLYLVIGSAASLSLHSFSVKRLGERAAYCGVVLVFLAGLTSALLLLPGVSFVVQWPLLLSLIATYTQWGSDKAALSPPARALRWFALLLLALFIGENVYVAVILDGGNMPALPMVFAATFLGVVLPLWSDIPASWRRRVLSTCPALATIAGAIGITSIDYDSDTPAMAGVSYGVDLDRELAAYLPSDTEHLQDDLWTLGKSELTSTSFSPSLPYGGFAKAPYTRLPGPRAHLIREESIGTNRRIEFTLSSESAAPCITLWAISDAQILETTIDGKKPHPFFRFSPETDRQLWTSMVGEDPAIDWKAAYCGMGANEARFSLLILGTAPLKIRIVEEFYELPSGMDDFRRGDRIIPAEWTDQSKISRVVEF